MIPAFRRYDVKTRLMLDVALLLFMLCLFQQLWLLSRPKPEAQLNYPEQRVLNNRVPGSSKPTALITDEIRTTGSKCNESGGPVDVTGTVVWISTDPPGSTITVGKGSTVRKPGCEAFNYSNKVPPAVVKRTRELISQGHPFVTWRMSGHEVPDDPMILPETWTTEEFDLYVELP